MAGAVAEVATPDTATPVQSRYSRSATLPPSSRAASPEPPSSASGLYVRYREVVEQLRAERLRSHQQEVVLSQVCAEVEARAAALTEQREERERQATETAAAAAAAEQAREEVRRLELRLRTQGAALGRAERDRESARAEADDLARQVARLLRDRDGASGAPKGAFGGSSAADVTSELLVEFGSVEELITRNRQLLAVNRTLTSEAEAGTTEACDKLRAEYEEALASISADLDRLREARKSAEDVVRDVAAQRDAAREEARRLRDRLDELGDSGGETPEGPTVREQLEEATRTLQEVRAESATTHAMLAEEGAAERQRAEDARRELAKAKASLEFERAQAERQKRALEAARAQADSLLTSSARLSADLEAKSREFAGALAETSRLRDASRAAEHRVEELEARCRVLSASEERAGAEAAEATAARFRAVAELEASKAAFAAKEEELRAESSRARKAAATAEADVSDARRELEAARTRAEDALRQLREVEASAPAALREARAAAEAARARAEDAEARATRREERVEELEARVRDLQRELETATTSKPSSEAPTAVQTLSAPPGEGLVAASESSIAAGRAAQTQVLLLRSELAAAKEARDAAAAAQRHLEELARAAEREAAEAKEDKERSAAAARAEVEEALASRDSAREHAESVERASAEAAATLVARERELAELRGQFEAAEAQAAEARARSESLEKEAVDAAAQLELARAAFDAEVVAHGDALRRSREAEEKRTQLEARVAEAEERAAEADAARLSAEADAEAALAAAKRELSAAESRAEMAASARDALTTAAAARAAGDDEQEACGLSETLALLRRERDAAEVARALAEREATRLRGEAMAAKRAAADAREALARSSAGDREALRDAAAAAELAARREAEARLLETNAALRAEAARAAEARAASMREENVEVALAPLRAQLREAEAAREAAVEEVSLSREAEARWKARAAALAARDGNEAAEREREREQAEATAKAAEERAEAAEKRLQETTERLQLSEAAAKDAADRATKAQAEVEVLQARMQEAETKRKAAEERASKTTLELGTARRANAALMAVANPGKLSLPELRRTVAAREARLVELEKKELELSQKLAADAPVAAQAKVDVEQLRARVAELEKELTARKRQVEVGTKMLDAVKQRAVASGACLSNEAVGAVQRGGRGKGGGGARAERCRGPVKQLRGQQRGGVDAVRFVVFGRPFYYCARPLDAFYLFYLRHSGRVCCRVVGNSSSFERAKEIGILISSPSPGSCAARDAAAKRRAAKEAADERESKLTAEIAAGVSRIEALTKERDGLAARLSALEHVAASSVPEVVTAAEPRRTVDQGAAVEPIAVVKQEEKVKSDAEVKLKANSKPEAEAEQELEPEPAMEAMEDEATQPGVAESVPADSAPAAALDLGAARPSEPASDAIASLGSEIVQRAVENARAAAEEPMDSSSALKRKHEPIVFESEVPSGQTDAKRARSADEGQGPSFEEPTAAPPVQAEPTAAPLEPSESIPAPKQAAKGVIEEASPGAPGAGADDQPRDVERSEEDAAGEDAQDAVPAAGSTETPEAALAVETADQAPGHGAQKDASAERDGVEASESPAEAPQTSEFDVFVDPVLEPSFSPIEAEEGLAGPADIIKIDSDAGEGETATEGAPPEAETSLQSPSVSLRVDVAEFVPSGISDSEGDVSDGEGTGRAPGGPAPTSSAPPSEGGTADGADAESAKSKSKGRRKRRSPIRWETPAKSSPGQPGAQQVDNDRGLGRFGGIAMVPIVWVCPPLGPCKANRRRYLSLVFFLLSHAL